MLTLHSLRNNNYSRDLASRPPLACTISALLPPTWNRSLKRLAPRRLTRLRWVGSLHPARDGQRRSYRGSMALPIVLLSAHNFQFHRNSPT